MEYMISYSEIGNILSMFPVLYNIKPCNLFYTLLLYLLILHPYITPTSSLSLLVTTSLSSKSASLLLFCYIHY